jgi:hypothetical protein
LTDRVSVLRTTRPPFVHKLVCIDRLISERKVTMSIESDAQHDLSLTEEDAEGVAGGRMNKKTKKAAKPHSSPAVTSYVVQGTPAPPGTDPGTPAGESQAELESDPDC